MVIYTWGIEVRNREIWNIRQPAYIKSSYKLVIHTIRKQGDNLMFFIVPLGSGLKIKMSFCGVILQTPIITMSPASSKWHGDAPHRNANRNGE